MVQLSGATRQSLANLLESYATHSIIESLYMRFDVDPIAFDTNKLRKANHLIRELNERNDSGTSVVKLVEYVGSPTSRMAPEFRRGNPAAVDLYEHFDRDIGRPTTQSTPSTATGEPERQFRRPGTSAPATAAPSVASSRRYVFVVRGRDNNAYDALSALLGSLDLRIVTWEDAARGVGGGSPQTLDIVRSGIEMADGVVVLMTPDDLGQVKPEFLGHRDDPREAKATGQARQNVVFEAGWAMALNQGSQ
jgi:Predicted nucleotide-binding protein containing TIR -like domain